MDQLSSICVLSSHVSLLSLDRKSREAQTANLIMIWHWHCLTKVAPHYQASLLDNEAFNVGHDLVELQETSQRCSAGSSWAAKTTRGGSTDQSTCTFAWSKNAKLTTSIIVQWYNSQFLIFCILNRSSIWQTSTF